MTFPSLERENWGRGGSADDVFSQIIISGDRSPVQLVASHRPCDFISWFLVFQRVPS